MHQDKSSTLPNVSFCPVHSNKAGDTLRITGFYFYVLLLYMGILSLVNGTQVLQCCRESQSQIFWRN